MTADGHTGCGLLDRFSLKDKFFMRIGWLGFMAVGAYGIYRQDPIGAFLYIAWGVLGFALVVLPFLCAYCPYPYQLSSCLFMPPQLVTRFYAPRGLPIPAGKKIAAGAALASMALIPQFWLFRDIPLLLLFWLIAAPVIAAFPLHYCSRCRHSGCPMNRAVRG
jgi:hypothetical protein